MDLIGKEQLMGMRLKIPQREQPGRIRAQYGKYRIDARGRSLSGRAWSRAAVDD